MDWIVVWMVQHPVPVLLAIAVLIVGTLILAAYLLRE